MLYTQYEVEIQLLYPSDFSYPNFFYLLIKLLQPYKILPCHTFDSHTYLRFFWFPIILSICVSIHVSIPQHYWIPLYWEILNVLLVNGILFLLPFFFLFLFYYQWQKVLLLALFWLYIKIRIFIYLLFLCAPKHFTQHKIILFLK